MSERLVSVAVPVAVDRAFTYRVPDEWPAVPSPGTRVLVPFGTRVLIGVVRGVTEPEPASPSDKTKALLEELDDGRPALPPDVVRLCEWMTDYYVAPLGEVYRLALPGLLTNADARTAAITHTGLEALQQADGALFARGGDALDDADRRLLEAVAHTGSTGFPVARATKLEPRIPAALRRLAELGARGLVTLSWEDAEVEGRTELHVRRTDYLRGSGADEGALQQALGRSKQRRALLDYLEGQLGGELDGWVPLSELRGPFPRVRALLGPLVEARLVSEQERPRELDPFEVDPGESSEPQAPTPDQSAALAAMRAAIGTFRSVLLHGITGSGKTEVYLQLIAELRSDRHGGRGAIVLVPEIALTPQLADRFRARFGNAVAVLHSGLTPRQRLDAWQQIRDGLRPIVIGARSAIFAPVPRLGAIVVDEEHDPSFKQEDGVRYNARDIALVRGRDLDALVVLGSATPSLESWALAKQGRHLWLRLRSRPTPRPLPTVELIPLSVHRPDPESLMTGVLRQALLDTVGAGEQAIVFLNRRGYTTSLVCEACGSFQHCPDCSAPSMTYHLSRNRLMCHLCGHIEGTPQRCHDCGNTTLCHGGVGTEKVEVALSRALHGVRVLRLDRDTTRGRQLLDTLARFRRREADVLVGTQMLSKGHDFPGVTLVGILQGDHGLALPDPRAAERTFQLLTQVAGRAGRGDRPGRVLVQAYAIEHPAITFAKQHDFDGFAERELVAREALGNPPAGHLALVRISGLQPEKVEQRARDLALWLGAGVERLEAEHGSAEAPVAQLLGPVPSPIQRINRRTRWQILLRARARKPLRWLLSGLRPRLGVHGRGAAETQAFVDVDPQSLL